MEIIHVSFVYCLIAIQNLILFLWERDLKLFLDEVIINKEKNTFQFVFSQKGKTIKEYQSNEFIIENKRMSYVIKERITNNLIGKIEKSALIHKEERDLFLKLISVQNKNDNV